MNHQTSILHRPNPLSSRGILAGCILAATIGCSAETSLPAEPGVEYLEPTQRFDVGHVLDGHYVEATHRSWGLEYELFSPEHGEAPIAGGEWDFEAGSRSVWTTFQPEGVTDEVAVPEASDRSELAEDAALHLAIVLSMTDEDDENDFVDAEKRAEVLLIDRYNPKGSMDFVRTGEYSIRFAGWTCDLDRPQAPLVVSFYGARPGPNLYLGQRRADAVRERAVGNACGGFRAHGFDVVFEGRFEGGWALAEDIDSSGKFTGRTTLQCSNSSCIE